MDIWRDPAFDKSILGIAQAYGPYEFWTQNLQPGMNPDATWRGLLVVAALKDRAFAPNARNLLGNNDSRVRAWACFTLAHLKDEAALEGILALREDISCRVRFHSRRAAQTISGKPVSPGRPLYEHAWLGDLILLSDDSPDAQKRVEDALRLKPLAIVTDNQKGRDNLSGLNTTWDLCRLPELRETVLFMLTADYVEPAFLWNGGDWFMHQGRLSQEMQVKPIMEYLGA
jgi:hypothetical protein